jgi:hypothetical protein
MVIDSGASVRFELNRVCNGDQCPVPGFFKSLGAKLFMNAEQAGQYPDKKVIHGASP